MRVILLALSTLAAVLILPPREALAFELLPISREFAPSGSGATQSYEVVSREKEPIAINVSVVARALDSEGVESHRSADDDFLVYPAQFILAPGARQTLRVTWFGDPVPERELAFRLVVEQLPLERFQPQPTHHPSLAKGAFRVLTRYLGSLYIRPAQAKAHLVAESTRVERGASGEPLLAVTVHNRGTTRAVLKNYQLQVKGRGAEPAVWVAPGADALRSGVVLPDGKRRLLFPWPHGFEPGEVTMRPAGPQG